MSTLMHIRFIFILRISQVCVFASTECLWTSIAHGCYLYTYIGGMTQSLQED